jgi:hypothetical protein
MRLHRFLCLAGIFALLAGSAGAARQPLPGTPLPDVQFTVGVSKKITRLMTQVEPGDVVVLKSGATSRKRAAWIAILRFEVRRNREAATGFATVILDQGNNFRGVKLQPNLTFIQRSSATPTTTYAVSGNKRNGKVRSATYIIDPRGGKR